MRRSVSASDGGGAELRAKGRGAAGAFGRPCRSGSPHVAALKALFLGLGKCGRSSGGCGDGGGSGEVPWLSKWAFPIPSDTLTCSIGVLRCCLWDAVAKHRGSVELLHRAAGSLVNPVVGRACVRLSCLLRKRSVCCSFPKT